jgi:hypothetical protein
MRSLNRSGTNYLEAKDNVACLPYLSWGSKRVDSGQTCAAISEPQKESLYA